jgi:hypothetical protein
MPGLRLLTQAYGRDDIREQALYAAWSALAWCDHPGLEFHVYTDAPGLFAPLGERVKARVLSPEEIRAWRGPHDFVHRLKAAMIRDSVRRDSDGKLLYVDADVAFRTSPLEVFERIGPGRAVLHVREYDVLTHPTKQLRRFRRRMRKVTFRGRPVELAHGMWNAGAVGLDATHYPLVDEWLSLVDEVYPQWPYWIHEQWAISQLLERAGTVSPADDVVFHYWAQKDEALLAIRRELEVLRTRPLADALAHLRDHPLVLPPPVRRRSTLRERIGRLFRRR